MEKTILITGASSGFGKLTVPLLLKKGHTVIAGIRGGERRLQDVFAAEIKDFPGRLHAIDLHLDDSASLANAVQFIDTRFDGRLDVLINNAGYGLMGVLEDQSEEQIRSQMEVNFFGTVFLTRLLLPSLRKGGGRILSVSSIAGVSGFPFYGAYNASKFALEGMMEALCSDLKPFGVQVGMVEPGGFKTQFVTARQFGVNSADPASPYYGRTEAFLRLFTKTSESRLGDPVKVARLIQHLCDCRRVPLRNWVGTDARFIRLLRAVLPDNLRVRLIGFLFDSALKRS